MPHLMDGQWNPNPNPNIIFVPAHNLSNFLHLYCHLFYTVCTYTHMLKVFIFYIYTCIYTYIKQPSFIIIYTFNTKCISFWLFTFYICYSISITKFLERMGRNNLLFWLFFLIMEEICNGHSTLTDWHKYFQKTNIFLTSFTSNEGLSSSQLYLSPLLMQTTHCT